jgi:hypothetical protein
LARKSRACRLAHSRPGLETAEISVVPLLGPRSAPRWNRGRWPRATGLVSYPSSCRLFLRRTTFRPPARSKLVATSRVLAGLQPTPSLGALTSRGAFPFSRPGCDTVAIWRHLKFVLPRRDRVFPALARSHNLRSVTDCVRPSARNHRPTGRHWASRVICVMSCPTAFAAVAMTPLAPWFPRCTFRRMQLPLREPVTSA